MRVTMASVVSVVQPTMAAGSTDNLYARLPAGDPIVTLMSGDLQVTYRAPIHETMGGGPRIGDQYEVTIQGPIR